MDFFEDTCRALRLLIEAYRERLDTSMTHSATLCACLRDVTDLTTAVPGNARAHYEERKRTLTREQQSCLDELERDYFTLIADSVRGGVLDGELRDVDPTMATHALIAMASHSRRWFSAGGRYPPWEVSDLYWQLFTNDVRNTVSQGAHT